MTNKENELETIKCPGSVKKLHDSGQGNVNLVLILKVGEGEFALPVA